jgi:hypothetical protein
VDVLLEIERVAEVARDPLARSELVVDEIFAIQPAGIPLYPVSAWWSLPADSNRLSGQLLRVRIGIVLSNSLGSPIRVFLGLQPDQLVILVVVRTQRAPAANSRRASGCLNASV